VQTASPFAFASIKADVVRSAGLLATTGGEPIPLSSFFSVLPGMPMPNEAEAAKLIRLVPTFQTFEFFRFGDWFI
jgi:hypothetical protein